MRETVGCVRKQQYLCTCKKLVDCFSRFRFLVIFLETKEIVSSSLGFSNRRRLPRGSLFLCPFVSYSKFLSNHTVATVLSLLISKDYSFQQTHPWHHPVCRYIASASGFVLCPSSSIWHSDIRFSCWLSEPVAPQGYPHPGISRKNLLRGSSCRRPFAIAS